MTVQKKLPNFVLSVLAVNWLILANVMGLTYTVAPDTKPVDNTFVNFDAYNSYTKQYFMLRSYIDKLEAGGGGILKLTKGQYTVPATLYIPGNITISCGDGVEIIKGDKTGSAKLQVSRNIFQFVSREKSLKVGAVKKYAGSGNIKLIGTGSATINMNYSKDAISIIMGNNSNVLIRGMTFKKAFGGNYIRVSSSRNVIIRNNRFVDAKFSADGKNDAIKLCTPDKTTSNFAYDWSVQDKNPNLDITIKSNVFDHVERAIGSNVYSEGVYHKNISIVDNKISNTAADAIRALNWDDVIITGNEITGVAGGESGSRGVLASGVRGITAKDNIFSNIGRPIQFMPYKNLGVGSSYETTYNTLSAQNRADLPFNSASIYKEGFIRINSTYGVFDEDTELVFLKQEPFNDFVIDPATLPYQGVYSENDNYNASTKHYFLLRSYMEALERSGGGTLRFKKGTYVISNVVYVPSNITVTLDNGVIIRKGKDTGAVDFEESLTMFECVRPSKAKQKGVYGGYNGETNIHFVGTGSATIDLDYLERAICITFGHCTNVSVKNLNFRNNFFGHFIEMDATRDAVVSGNDFRDSKASDKMNKEAINLDTPDKATGGFTHDWSTYDRTPNKNVTIENNTFFNVDVAVGTHLYSEGQYHENVVIRNNDMQQTRREAIRVLNWKKCIIENNSISDIADNPNDGQQNRALFISGSIYPTIRLNTIRNVSRPMQFCPFKDTHSGYNATYNTLSQANKVDAVNNNFFDIVEPFIRVNTILNDFSNGTQKLLINVQ